MAIEVEGPAWWKVVDAEDIPMIMQAHRLENNERMLDLLKIHFAECPGRYTEYIEDGGGNDLDL